MEFKEEILNIKLANFNNKLNQLDKVNLELKEISEDIIEKFCPFKIGCRVAYREWWRGNNKEYFGIVKSIKFKGIDKEAIENKWIICVETTTKDFSKPKGGYNASYKYLGVNKNDFIKAI